MEATVQPEDHGGRSCVHQQSQRVVTLWWLATASQAHEQHPEPWAEE